MSGLTEDTDLLKALCDWSGLTPSRLGDEAGLASTTILRPYNGTATTRLSVPTLEKLRARFPEFPGWIATQTSDRRMPFTPAPVEQDPDLVQIDMIDMAFGLGGTFIDDHAVEVEKVSFSRNWLRSYTISSPELLFTTSGIGDSMEPTISDHDVIIVDRGQNRLQGTKGDKIWACVFGGSSMVKRLRALPDGTVRVMSDNERVRDEIATDGDLHIVGRVVVVAKRF